MGTCISKCSPKKSTQKTHKNESQNQEECKCQCIKETNPNLVQDKLVISTRPKPEPVSSIKYPLSPTNSSPSRTNSNYPATSSSSNSNSNSCSLLSPASSIASYSSSSIVSSKLGRSLQNSKLTRPDYQPIKVLNPKRSSLPTKYHINNKRLNGPKNLISQSSPQKVVGPVAQKRPRSSSPSNLTRQKSFRRETEPESESNRPISRSERYPRPISPSPSNRLLAKETSITQSRNFTNSMRRDNCYVRPPSPRRINGASRRYNRSNNNLSSRNDDGVRIVNSKIQELAIGGLSSQDIDMMPIEDSSNPHITLDCFIFL